MYGCMDVCMYVCMYMYKFAYIHIYFFNIYLFICIGIVRVSWYPYSAVNP